MIGPQLERHFVRLGRVVGTAELLIDVAEVVERIDVVGPDVDRPTHEIDGQKRPALLVAHDPEVVQGIGIVFVRLQDAEINALGFFELPALVKGDCGGKNLPGRRGTGFQAFHGQLPLRVRSPRR